MKRLFIVYVMVLLFFSEFSHAQSFLDPVSLRLDVTPNPVYNQVETGKSYSFLLKIENNNITLKEGDLVEQPDGQFSGNLTVKIEYLLGKSGYVTYGSNSMIYGAIIGRWERSYTFGLPELGRSVNVTFPYNCSQSYDPKNATVSEWLKLMLKITVYIVEYSGQEQNKTFRNGPVIMSYEASYFIINDEKKLYVEEKLLEIESEINNAFRDKSLIENITGQTFYIDLSAPMKDYAIIKDFVDKGDYVSAMNATRYWWHDLKQELIDSLLSNYESFAGYKAALVQYRDERDMTQVELDQQITVNQYYLVGFIGLAASTLFLSLSPRLRGVKGKVKPKQSTEPTSEEPLKYEEPRRPMKKSKWRTKTSKGIDKDLERARALLNKE